MEEGFLDMMDVGNVSNTTDPPTLPEDMVYNDGHRISIIVNSILMVVSAIGNLTVLVILAHRRRTSPSRINVTLMHLAIADLLVTFLTIPLEIGWAATVSWRAGDTMCRIMAYLRVFGIYLSSFVLVCISIDRYYAVLKPLQLCAIDRRGRYMLAAAWVGSAISSIPQALIFHEEQHPVFTWYKQCVSFNAFTTYVHEVGYSMFGMVLMYIFPLTIIICSYTAILSEIFRRSREPIGASFNLGRLGKARIRTLKMTVIIVVVFFVCWTPYHVMAFWYMIDKESAHKVDLRVQKGLFLFACTNSCMNPIVYGAFNIRPRRATAQVAGLARRKESMEALAKKLEGKKGKFFAIKADLTQEQDILNAFKWVKQNLGPISVLINNAGRIELTTLIDGDTNAWKTTVDLNVIGLCIATREAVRDMRKNNIDGHIVHINSVGGHQVPPLPNINIYPATKFAVTALTETLRNELNSIGSKIKITSISPGAVQTEMAQNAINNPEIPKELLKKLKDMAFLKPADIADSTIYVLSTPPHVQVHELTVITVNQPSL